MKQFTVIWEERWMSGSHHFCMTKKTWIECNNIQEIMESAYGPRARYIFEGFQCTIGETVDLSEVVRELTPESTY
jgi:hypothetical protein